MPVSLPPPLQVDAWRSVPHLRHGFYGRRGGCSRGRFAELNLSPRVGDDPNAVRENWARIGASTADGLCFTTLRQVHGATIAVVDHAAAEAGEADGVVTAASGVGLCILTADCVPILLLAPDHGVVAAVHAGWRGTLAGIAAEALRCLTERWRISPADVSVALGPAIGECCYEVDASIADQLEQRWGRLPQAAVAAPRRGRSVKAHLDLRQINRSILANAGVSAAAIAVVGPCTRCHAAQYFSHRAAMAAGEGGTGRQVGYIGWHR